MKLSGIDNTLFSAYSTHEAATSKAKSISWTSSWREILEAANWSWVPHFAHFYNRPVNSCSLEELCCKADNQESFEWYHLL